MVAEESDVFYLAAVGQDGDVAARPPRSENV